MSSGLQVSGVISGLSTSDIIQKLMDVERLPLLSLQKRKEKAQQEIDALKDVNTRLSSLLSTIQKLGLRSTIDVKSVSTDTPASSATLVTATASSDAAVGSFTVKVVSLATATTVTSEGAGGAEAIGDAVQANQPLASAGFGITPGTGKFSVNGVQVTIDDTTVLSDGIDAVGANTIFAKIRDATASLDASKRVTASWGLDDNGRQNKLVLSAAGAIQLGAGSDTSNFLTAAGLASLPPAATMTSARNLGGVNARATLDSSEANLATALLPATGSFMINGVEIEYDTSVDTLNSLISRINASAAGVIATFDSINDRLTLTSRTTGSSLMNLEDVTGNFLAAMKLDSDNETVGSNASYLLNGEQRYSGSNTVTDAVAGVTLSLRKEDPATTVTLTVSQETSSAVNSVKDFVSQYNSTLSFIREKSSHNTTLDKASVLEGDTMIQRISTTLASLVNGYGDGLSSVARSFSDVGITTGAVGTGVGATYDLSLDENVFVTKLRTNATAVADLFGGLGKNVALEAGGTGSISSITGSPSDHASGTYSIVSDGAGNLTATFTPASGGATTVRTGTIGAGGTNTSLIPGVVLTAKNPLLAGTDTITADFTPKGVGVKITDYLTSLTSSGGVFAKRQDVGGDQIDDVDKSIQRLQDRLDRREAILNTKFVALEKALAQLQGQSMALASQVAKLSSD